LERRLENGRSVLDFRNCLTLHSGFTTLQQDPLHVFSSSDFFATLRTECRVPVLMAGFEPQWRWFFPSLVRPLGDFGRGDGVDKAEIEVNAMLKDGR
jgi:hypothetical protein